MQYGVRPACHGGTGVVTAHPRWLLAQSTEFEQIHAPRAESHCACPGQIGVPQRAQSVMAAVPIT